MSSLNKPLLSSFFPETSSNPHPSTPRPHNNSTNNTFLQPSPNASIHPQPTTPSSSSQKEAIIQSIDASTVAAASVGNVGSWGLTVVIFFLVPLFFLQLSQTIFPMVNAPQVDISPQEADKYQKEANRIWDLQYITVLSLSALGVIISIVLAMNKVTSRSTTLGLAYGSLATMVVAVYGNSSRLSGGARVSIIGVIIVCCLFLPRMTSDVLLK